MHALDTPYHQTLSKREMNLYRKNKTWEPDMYPQYNYEMVSPQIHETYLPHNLIHGSALISKKDIDNLPPDVKIILKILKDRFLQMVRHLIIGYGFTDEVKKVGKKAFEIGKKVIKIAGDYLDLNAVMEKLKECLSDGDFMKLAEEIGVVKAVQIFISYLGFPELAQQIPGLIHFVESIYNQYKTSNNSGSALISKKDIDNLPPDVKIILKILKDRFLQMVRHLIIGYGFVDEVKKVGKKAYEIGKKVIKIAGNYIDLNAVMEKLKECLSDGDFMKLADEIGVVKGVQVFIAYLGFPELADKIPGLIKFVESVYKQYTSFSKGEIEGRGRNNNAVGIYKSTGGALRKRQVKTTGGAKKRTIKGGQSVQKRRASKVREIMKSKGYTLPQASKYIKENNIQY